MTFKPERKNQGWYSDMNKHPRRPETKIIIECTYAGLRVSKRVKSIWITLTMAESFFSLSKMFDSNCSTVSCLKRKTNSPFSTTALACLKLELNFNPSKYATFQKVTRKLYWHGQTHFSSVASRGSGSEQPCTWNIWSLLNRMISQSDWDAFECLCVEGTSIYCYVASKQGWVIRTQQ